MSRIEEIMESLKTDSVKKSAMVPAERDEVLILPDEHPTIRDLATALYGLHQGRTCKNCIHRERQDCHSRNPQPKTCISFQLNSRQMANYGQMAKNMVKAWREAIAIHAAREAYRRKVEFERMLEGGDR